MMKARQNGIVQPLLTGLFHSVSGAPRAHHQFYYGVHSHFHSLPLVQSTWGIPSTVEADSDFAARRLHSIYHDNFFINLETRLCVFC
jgi:hypothetical protein